MIDHRLRWLVLFGSAILTACSLQPFQEASPGSCNCSAPPVAPVRINPLEPVDFAALPGWKDGEQAAAWGALLTSCQALRWREAWRRVCAQLMELRIPGDDEAQELL